MGRHNNGCEIGVQKLNAKLVSDIAIKKRGKIKQSTPIHDISMIKLDDCRVPIVVHI
jgi:hypothetical protein